MTNLIPDATLIMSHDQIIIPYNTVVCNEGDTRLCDSSGNCGTDMQNGRLEYCQNEAWGSVCNNMWSFGDAQVACVQLGYSAQGDTLVQ